MFRQTLLEFSRFADAFRQATRSAFVLLVLVVSVRAVCAQDTRTVAEPRIPAACAVLAAEKVGHAEILPPEYEKTTDTARIQRALDTCKPGQAVELALGKGNAG